MIRDKGQSVALYAGFSQQAVEAVKKIAPIGVIKKDLAPFDAANNDMILGAQGCRAVVVLAVSNFIKQSSNSIP